MPKQGPRPHTWKYPNDAVMRAKNTAYQRHRCQALYRDEPYELSFEDYCEMWGDDWHKRGRGSQDLCMHRIDIDTPWSKHNIEIVERRQYLREKIVGK